MISIELDPISARLSLVRRSMPRQGVYTARTNGDLLLPPLSIQPRGRDFDMFHVNGQRMKQNKWLCSGFFIPVPA